MTSGDPERLARVLRKNRAVSTIAEKHHGHALLILGASGNTNGPAVLASECVRHATRVLTFSSDLVFDGGQRERYVESDAIHPLGVYGRSKAEAESRVLNILPSALVVRTSSFFGPWDEASVMTRALHELAAGRAFVAAHDVVVSPAPRPVFSALGSHRGWSMPTVVDALIRYRTDLLAGSRQ